MSCLYKAKFIYLHVLRLCVFLAICEAQNVYYTATATAEALYPRGLRLILKDDGYTSVEFNVFINEEFRTTNNSDVVPEFRPSHKTWVYEDRDVVLKVGDIIMFSIYYTLRNGKVKIKPYQEYKVTEFVNEDGTHFTPAISKDLEPPPPPAIHPDEVPPENPSDESYDDTVPSKCVISKTMVQGNPNTCKDQLLFSEDFAKRRQSLRQLDKWDAMIQFPGEPDYPFNVYIPDNTISFEKGSLVITPKLTESQYAEGFLDLADRCTSLAGTPECRREVAGAQTIPPVTTAKITTRRSFNFMFGRVEVRAKLPSGSWLTPEINLESSDNAYGPDNYESGLMRVAFVRGNPGLAKTLYGGPVLTESEPFRSALLQEKIGIDNWHQDFHNYTMIWRPDGIDLLVDGEQYGTVNPSGVQVGSGFFEAAKKNNVTHASRWQKGTVMAPLDKMFHITLGLRVGGVNDFSDDLEDKPWRNGASKAMLNFWRSRDSWHPSWDDASLRVDYVRVYAL